MSVMSVVLARAPHPRHDGQHRRISHEDDAKKDQEHVDNRLPPRIGHSLTVDERLKEALVSARSQGVARVHTG